MQSCKLFGTSRLAGGFLFIQKTGRQIALSARLLSYGAEGETRTPMKEPSLDPEPSVSTNSTTSARRCI